MERNLAYLLPENLYRVFNETDLDKRKGAIAELIDDLLWWTAALKAAREQ
jgi:hypothetical protein